MRRLLVLLLTSAVACAGPAPGTGATPVEQKIVVQGGGSGGLNYVPSSGVSTREFAYPVDRVWKVMPAVFDSVSVPVDLLDPQTHMIGNRAFKLRGKLGKTPLGRYIDCGMTQIGPNAESYDVTLTLTAALSMTPGGATAMTIDVEASARPLVFAQEPFRCSTKGNLEQRVTELTRALLNR